MTERILIVEDNPIEAREIECCLHEAGFHVEVVGDAEQGFARLESEHFDVLLCDLHLPGENGFALCRRVKQSDALRRTPVVLLTRHADPLNFLRGLEAGADGFISKGQSATNIIERLKRVLSRQQAVAQNRQNETDQVVFLQTEFEITSQRSQLLEVLLSGFEDVVLLNSKYEEETTARMEAQKSLRTSEARFQQLASHLDDVLWMTSADGAEMIYVSPAYETIWGRSCASLYEHPADWTDGLHPEDRERMAETFYERAALGNCDDTFRVVRPDGSMRWVHATAMPIRDSEGDVYRIAGVARDVTEAKEANEQLSRFKSTLDHTNDCVFMFRPGTLQFFYCNRGATRQVGYSADELMQMTPLDITPLFDEPRFRKIIDPLVDGREESLMFETVHRHKDGHDISVEVCLQYVAPADEPPRFVAIVRDIAERTRVNEQMKTLNAQLQTTTAFQEAVLNSTKYAIIATNTDGLITCFNLGAERLFGYRADEMVDRISPEIIHDKDEVAAYARVLSDELGYLVEPGFETFVAKARLGRADEHEWSCVCKDGSRVPVHLSVTAIRGEHDSISGFLGVAYDITRRKETERDLLLAKQQAEEASQAKSQFLSSMSHELRTPLNGVIGMTELLAGTDLSAKQQQFVDACRNSGESLLQLINDILDFSKIEAGKLELDLHDFNLETLVTDTVDTMAWRALDKTLEMPCYVDRVSRTILKGDSHRLRQILVNLVGNAIKFTEAGEVVVRATTVGQQDGRITVRFSVADTGIGIPSDKLDRLFQSFSQVDACTTRTYGGTGLGLAISQSLVELMGGTIGVDSEAGKGSTFWFEVPFVLVSDKSDDASGRPHLAGLRALIVDDNETNRIILTEYTSGWGLAAISTASVDEALAAVDRAETIGSPFHVVLTDYNMPQRNGLDLSRALKQHPQMVVLLLGSTDICLDPDQMHEHGIDAILRKPLRRHELYDVLCGVLDCRNAVTTLTGNKPHSANEARRLSGRILLAEDNSINKMYVVELMKQLGCTCDTVTNGREATEAVRQRNYDLVLMDCQMPEMDGFEATRHIRQWESDGTLDGHLPIIALTANAVRGDRQRCLDAGMDEYLSKPVQQNEVASMFARFLDDAEEPATEASVAMNDEADKVPDSAPIDAESLLARCFGNVEFAGSLLDELESTGIERVQEIRQYAAQQNAVATADAAHALKGAAGILCAESVQKLAAEIEQAGRSSNIGDVEAEIGDLAAEMQRCLNYIPQLRQELNTLKEGV